MMSRWSWRSLRSSAQRHRGGAGQQPREPASRSAAGRGRSAEPAGDAALARTSLLPPFLRRSVTGDGREHVLERARRRWRRSSSAGVPWARRAAVVHDRQPVAVALGLLHQVRGDDDRRPGLARAARAARSHTSPRAVGSRPTVGSSRNSTRGPVEQRGGDLEPPQHAARERPRQPVEHRLEPHRLDRRRRSARAARAAARR